MGKKLVAYFSASGVTKGLAQKLANSIGADLFEIKPAVAYTRADLDWTDKKSRSSLEMRDSSSRPEIAQRLAQPEEYDTVFIGFPIWWYREPSIIDTFMQAYDFDGKTVIPFATSGSSTIGDCSKNIQRLAPAATVAPGKRFAAGTSAQMLASWAEEWI